MRRTPVFPPHRRTFLGGASALGLLGLEACATAADRPARTAIAPLALDRTPIAPIRARADRIFDIAVCLRPFRAAGPRLDAEQVGDTLVVHNYGHGGSGWSLSWGSAAIAVAKAMAGSPREIAVLGCGALGLTSAILAQRAGAKVTIYARELIWDARSFRATGAWTPDSRIALTDAAAASFPALWEQMARAAFKTWRQYLGLPGTPVEWVDHYGLADLTPPVQPPQPGRARGSPDDLDFASYSDRIADLTPRSEVLAPGSTPFPVARVRRSELMIFNLADLSHTLIGDFLAAGGEVRRMEFHTPADLALLEEKVVINCPGYGARDLWKDASIVPVRGQIARLIPQPEVRYGLFYRDVSVVPRRDGIVVQAVEGGDMKGYGQENETPDRAEAERAVGVLSGLFARFPGPAGG